MKVSELITFLQQMPQDLPVYGFCDHGQTPEICSRPQVAYTENDEYSPEWWTADAEAAEDAGYKTQFVIL